jgi:hypothetical protein
LNPIALPEVPHAQRGEDDGELSDLSVGAPLTVAAQEMRIECMFPADAETEARHSALLATSRIVPARGLGDWILLVRTDGSNNRSAVRKVH